MKCNTCGKEIDEENSILCTDCGAIYCQGGECEREDCPNNPDGLHFDH